MDKGLCRSQRAWAAILLPVQPKSGRGGHEGNEVWPWDLGLWLNSENGPGARRYAVSIQWSPSRDGDHAQHLARALQNERMGAECWAEGEMHSRRQGEILSSACCERWWLPCLAVISGAPTNLCSQFGQEGSAEGPCPVLYCPRTRTAAVIIIIIIENGCQHREDTAAWPCLDGGRSANVIFLQSLARLIHGRSYTGCRYRAACAVTLRIHSFCDWAIIGLTGLFADKGESCCLSIPPAAVSTGNESYSTCCITVLSVCNVDMCCTVQHCTVDGTCESTTHDPSSLTRLLLTGAHFLYSTLITAPTTDQLCCSTVWVVS